MSETGFRIANLPWQAAVFWTSVQFLMIAPWVLSPGGEGWEGGGFPQYRSTNLTTSGRFSIEGWAPYDQETPHAKLCHKSMHCRCLWMHVILHLHFTIHPASLSCTAGVCGWAFYCCTVPPASYSPSLKQRASGLFSLLSSSASLPQRSVCTATLQF
jgi:hypothetical protein